MSLSSPSTPCLTPGEGNSLSSRFDSFPARQQKDSTRELGWSQPSAQRTPGMEQPWLVPGQADSRTEALGISEHYILSWESGI